MAQRRARARCRCGLLDWSLHVLFRPLGVLHAQLWPRMVVPARHMFVLHVVQLIQRKTSCLESWHGLTISTTTVGSNPYPGRHFSDIGRAIQPDTAICFDLVRSGAISPHFHPLLTVTTPKFLRLRRADRETWRTKYEGTTNHLPLA